MTFEIGAPSAEFFTEQYTPHCTHGSAFLSNRLLNNTLPFNTK